MRANVRLIAILVTSIVVLAGSFADAQPESDQERPSSFLRDVAGDFVRFFTTREFGVILGLGLAGSASVWPLDDDIQGSRSEALLPGKDDGLGDVFKAGNHLGSILVQVGGSVATYTIGRLAGKPDVADVGRDLIRAQLVAGGVTRLLKHAVRRERPAGSESSRTSFPSGHTSSTFASATVLGRRLGWKVGVPAFGLASYVAASRVVDNSHFLSDVMFGAAIGVTAGCAVTFEIGAKRLQVSPMAVPRGIGVLVSIN